MDKFLIIGITPESIYKGDTCAEAEAITRLLNLGEADYVHIRHPLCNQIEIKRLISLIPEKLRPQLALHDHIELALSGLAGGIHTNNRNLPFMRQLPFGECRDIRFSRSCHSFDEASESLGDLLGVKCDKDFDYVTLSPIFDSISKKGYLSRFDEEDLRLRLPKIKEKVIALGGITKARIPLLKDIGFSGAAMLSALFP